MRQGEHDGERAVEQEVERVTGQVDVLQQRVENAVGAENRLPGVGTHQITHPQRNDDELIVEILSASGVEREEVSQRIAEQHGKKHHAGGDPHGAQQRLPVNGLGQ